MVELISAIRRALAQAGDPVRAAEQQAYMKSAMPFRGVRLPEVRRLARDISRAHPPHDAEHWQDTVSQLWDGAEYREERYAALVVARRHRAYAHALHVLPLYRGWVLDAQWWDLCDEIASHLVGGILAAHPESTTVILRTWSVEDNLWIRRVAILSQLNRKEHTDTDFLVYALEGSIHDRDFFARKAIGWALRQYARTDPGWVRQFLRTHPELSSLSVREATKHLGR